jgi:hypothetical protein
MNLINRLLLNVSKRAPFLGALLVNRRFFAEVAGVVVTNTLLGVYIFRFYGLYNFRDYLSVPFIYNVQSSGITLPFNTFVSLGGNPQMYFALFFTTLFSLSLTLNYFSLKQLPTVLLGRSEIKFSLINKLQIYFLSLFVVFNPWTFERFLMGQPTVLIGYLFFIPILTLMFRIKSYFSEKKYLYIFGNYLFLGFTLAFVAYLGGTHYTIFLLGFFFLLVMSDLAFKIIQEFRLKNKFSWKTVLINILGAFTTLIVISPVFLSIYGPSSSYNSNQFNYYQEVISESSEIKDSIIKASSLKVGAEEDYIVLRALIGSAGWMSNSIEEPKEISEKLGFVSIFLYYYNDYLAVPVLILLAVIVLLTNLLVLFYQGKPLKILLIKIDFLIIISLILNFGYSAGFEEINSYFYKLPLTYTFREAGKFYGLALSLIIILLTLLPFLKINYRGRGPSLLKKLINRNIQSISKFNNLRPRLTEKVFSKGIFNGLLLSVFAYLSFSNVLLFSQLAEVVPATNFPDIFSNLDRKCSNSKKVVSVPAARYIISEYTHTFHLNPIRYISKCKYFEADQTILYNSNTEEYITLARGENSEELNNKIKDTLLKKNPEIIFGYLREREVKALVLNTYADEKTDQLNKLLIQTQVGYESEDKIYIYYLDEVRD